MNSIVIPMSSFEGSSIGFDGCARLCSSTSSATSPSKRNGRRRRMCLISIARTLGGIFLFKRIFHNCCGHSRKSLEFDTSWIESSLYKTNYVTYVKYDKYAKYVKYAHISHCLNKSVARRNGYCFRSCKRKSFTR